MSDSFNIILSCLQVITWFQNRRAKLKRDLDELKADVTAATTKDPEYQPSDSRMSRVKTTHKRTPSPPNADFDVDTISPVVMATSLSTSSDEDNVVSSSTAYIVDYVTKRRRLVAT